MHVIGAYAFGKPNALPEVLLNHYAKLDGPKGYQIEPTARRWSFPLRVRVLCILLVTRMRQPLRRTLLGNQETVSLDSPKL